MNEIEDARAAGTYVISLDNAQATNRALVGGKGANLAHLIEADLPVPAGFCVTTAAYEELTDDPAIKAAIDELSDLDPSDTAAIAEVGSTLRTQIQKRSIPEEIRDAIEAGLNEMARDPEQAYAVRSSATAEDLQEASFAGQQETFLNVRGADKITDRVRTCMASLYTDRAIAYRATNDVPHNEVSLAVVVQQMVEPDVSGILFTADPQTGNRYIASIEAGIGLGEGLVSGEVTADTIRVETRTGEILEYEVGDQQSAVRATPEGGTKMVELDSTDHTSRVLTVEQIQTLVDLGEKIEALLKNPQDIEWCLDEGELYVVQSRPITSLFPLPSPLPDDDHLHVYFSMGHVQAFAEAMPPLARDIWMEFCQLWMVEMGMDATTQWTVEAGGRIYIDMTPFLRNSVLRRGFPKWLSATSEPLAAAVKDLVARRGEEFQSKRTARETLTLLRRVAGTVRTQARPMTSAIISGFVGAFIGEPTPERERDRWNTWGQNAADYVRTPETPTERVRAAFDTNNSALINFPRIGPLYAAMVAEGLLQHLFSDVPEELNDVGRGFPDELVTRINLGLGDLADVARDYPAVADALREGASINGIEPHEGRREFRDALDAFLVEFGHRATGELDVSRPRWHEDPSGLLAIVRANLEHGEKGEHRERITQLERGANAAAKRLEHRAGQGILGPLRKRFVRQLIRTYRGYIQTREDPKHSTAHLFAAWHEVLRDAGEALVVEGQLNEIDDVWFLWKDELFAALDGDTIDVDILARRAEFERYAAMAAPPVLTSEGEAPSAAIEHEDIPDGALVGTGVSSGVVEGTAHVVHDPSKETIERGEILIAPSSDPGWTPLFLNAAGMVVEVGGRMSHGALVAREYGLPAVVSVPKATRRIKTGQRVRIDGTRGTVEILEDG